MNRGKRIWLLAFSALAIGFLALVIFLIYIGSTPTQYRLSPGEVSPVDIVAPRDIPDEAETARLAAIARAAAPDVMIRSQQISADSLNRIEQFLQAIEQLRQDPPLQPISTMLSIPARTTIPFTTETSLNSSDPSVTPTTDTPPAMTLPTTTVPTTTATSASRVIDIPMLTALIRLETGKISGVELTDEEGHQFATFSAGRFERMAEHIRTLGNQIMNETLDQSQLDQMIAERTQALERTMTYYHEDGLLIRRSLEMTLRPNVAYDKASTEKARQAAYDSVLRNPRMINRGTTLVERNAVITEKAYALLLKLDLIDTGAFDVQHFAGILLLVLLVLGIGVFYVRHYEKECIQSFNDLSAILTALLIPLLVATYMSRQAPLSAPVYFAAVLISIYCGFRAAVVLTFCLSVLILPMTGFHPTFLAVAMIGSIVAALFVQGIIRKDNYASIILGTAGANLFTTLAIGLINGEGWPVTATNMAYTGGAGAIAVIAAIGVTPLFEMIFNSISPLRLVELSQPGHPLLRRLSVEAPGSMQHSMMVANLADSAAAAIGANALLARVGAYYHDIGKLEQPGMFTENQEGQNPHDEMDPGLSADIITGHPDEGVRLGKRYRLPPAILRIIHEHHGTTEQVYFLNKARKLAEETQGEEPDPKRYRYQAPLPSTRESAIVMLADSVEAAVKSTGTNNLNDAQALVRRVVKQKNEQDQLIRSGLSFRDVEIIIQAFLQVYAGHFHERVKYPDDHRDR